MRVRVGESVRATLMSNQAHKLRKTLNLFNEACAARGRGCDKCICRLINVAAMPADILHPKKGLQN